MLQIHIIKETKDWMVISKPAGIQVERNPFGPSVESLVYAHLEAERRNPYVGIVHRLDRVTTGVVLVAKHRSVLRKLNRQFVEKDVRKTYLAAVSQPPPSEQGTLHHWLEKDRAAKRAIVHKEPIGKARECLLNYKVLTTTSDNRTLLELEPLTGRYHQIRAQLAFEGCPVAGDVHYGAAQPYQDHHIMLHAWKLEFFDERKKDRRLVEAPLPEWAEALK
ncbi:hypothetical protein IX84_07525 [Phaeodactylibacter xiamenensis]|uniref:Pseudouridine synthase RsuA/RluA-like domain-containing protein n=1 Tax=Phaeodactylibacter xiamenensis TaxID=1524460 RepID=A0A098SA47_9BACT|nr:hypothetical protein IX84_07525 [Phaeodactylibacter xiamenensis]